MADYLGRVLLFSGNKHQAVFSRRAQNHLGRILFCFKRVGPAAMRLFGVIGDIVVAALTAGRMAGHGNSNLSINNLFL